MPTAEKKKKSMLDLKVNNEDLRNVMIKYVSGEIIAEIKKKEQIYSSLAAQAIPFFSDLDNVKTNFSLSWDFLNGATVKDWVDVLKEMCTEPALFVEEVEKFMERAHCFTRLEKRIQKNPIATIEELNAGVFKDELESQVRDAVFTLRSKGYDTLQSGFTSSRSQTMTIYGSSIKIPSIVRKHLQKFKLRMICRQHLDATYIELMPTTNAPIMLSTWSDAWNCFAETMPTHTNAISRKFELPIHRIFKAKQKALQEKKNVFLGNVIRKLSSSEQT